MSTARQRDRWRRRMITLHGKAVDLCEDIEAAEGESDLWHAAMDVAVMCSEGVTNLGGYDHERPPKKITNRG